MRLRECSHEIKRHLLLGINVMTNLDIILKSRDITLPTKVWLVKAMVFPVLLRVGVQSLIRKLTSHKLCCVAQKKVIVKCWPYSLCYTFIILSYLFYS